jgi:hypothetical protein
MAWQSLVGPAIGAVGGYLNSGNNNEHIGSGELYGDDMQGTFNNLWTNIDNLQTPEYYQGQQIADINPMLQNSLQGMGDYGQPGGMGYDAQQAMYGGGNAGLGAMNSGIDYLGQMQDRGPNQFGYDQGTYDQSFGNLTGGMQNQFDLGAQQMQQNFDWNMLPGLNMAGALGGQNGSTKQYQQGALGQGLANQNIANMGSNLWMNAANQSNQNAMNAGSQNLGSANNFDSNLLSNYGNYGQLGSRMMGQGYDMNSENLGIGQNAAGLQQGYDQTVADSSRAQWDQDQNQPWMDQKNRNDFLQSYAVGQPYQDAGMSGWEGLTNGAMTGLGIYGAGQDAGWWGGNQDPFGGTSTADWTSGNF